MTESLIQKFTDKLAELGIPTDEPIEFDRLVKYDDPDRKARGERRAPAHWYCAYLNPWGIYARIGSHDTSKDIENVEWTSFEKSMLTPEQLQDYQQQIHESKLAYDEEVKRRLEKSRDLTAQKLSNCTDVPEDFDWLVKKKLNPNGIKYCPTEDCIIIPAYDIDKNLQAYQRVPRKPGEMKKNGVGTVFKEAIHICGDIDSSTKVYVGESWANAQAVHQATGTAAVATFGTGQIALTGKLLQDKYPDKQFFMLQDLGEAGEKAATEWKVFCKTEVFKPSEDDFSHVFATLGADAVKEQLKIPIIPIISGLHSIQSEDIPIDWVVENLIDNESINFIVAAGGTGKTLIAQQLAVALENGNSYMERLVPKERRVLYLDCEMGRKRYNRRLKKCNTLNDNPLRLPDSFCVDDGMRQGLGRINLSEPVWQNRLDSVFKNYDVIIIDSFNKSSELPTDQTRELHWRLIYHWLFKWRETKCIIFVHHTNKSGEIAGTQHLTNDADNVLEIFKVPQKDGLKKFELAFNIFKGRDIPFQHSVQFSATYTGHSSSNGGWQVQNETDHKKPMR